MAILISTHPSKVYSTPFIYYPIEKCANSFLSNISILNPGSTCGGYNIYDDQSRKFYEDKFFGGVANFSEPIENELHLATAQTLHYFYSKVFLKNAFQFTFVRHPLDRFVSAWIHGSIRPPLGVPSITFNITMSTDEMISTFNKFVDSFFNGINENLKGNPHFGRYLSCLPRNLEDLDFVGKLENFNNDLEYVINTIWESDKEIASNLVRDLLLESDEQKNLKGHNTKHLRKGISMEEFYFDNSKDMVKNYYKEELEAFGYE